MSRLLLIAAMVSAPCLAQELTHPMDMGLPESSYERPDPAEYQLSLENGLVAYVSEADYVPLVTLSAFVRAGRVSDDRQGAAESLAHALKNAAPGGMSTADFQSTIERMTAAFTVDMHDEWTEISLNVPAEDLDEALPLFAAIIRQPLVTETNIDGAARAAAPAASDLAGESGAALYEGSMNAAVDRFHEALYDGHPYGYRPTASDYEDLNVLDVAGFHASHFVPGNVTLAVAGDIDVDEINAQLVRLFGDWPAVEMPAPRQMPAVKRLRPALHHVVTSKLQSWLVIGHDLPPVPLEEQAAFEVMDYILGEYHMNTRLMRETRYKYGLTNDASSFREPRWDGPGSYTFRSYSRPEVIETIYQNVMGELHRIREEDVSDREMFVAIGALSDGAFQVRYLDGYALTRSFALERLRYGNHDRSASYVERVRQVTKEDVLEAAQKYIRPDRFQVVLLGQEAFDP